MYKLLVTAFDLISFLKSVRKKQIVAFTYCRSFFSYRATLCMQTRYTLRQAMTNISRKSVSFGGNITVYTLTGGFLSSKTVVNIDKRETGWGQQWASRTSGNLPQRCLGNGLWRLLRRQRCNCSVPQSRLRVRMTFSIYVRCIHKNLIHNWRLPAWERLVMTGLTTSRLQSHSHATLFVSFIKSN